MKKGNKKSFYFAVCMLVAFILWTVAISHIDVCAIGPQESTVGFATINQFVHNFTGVHMSLYVITDWLGLVPLAFAVGFALLGLVQWVNRKNLLKVDYNIFVLGGFYIIVFGAYIFFETVVINYRPVLINGYLEASYPSSTTMLVMCVMLTAILQFNNRIRNRIFKRCVISVMKAFVAFMVIGRLISGVHWVTDIIGGALLSSGLVSMYHFVNSMQANKKDV